MQRSCFPRLNIWQLESGSERGDGSVAAKAFLYSVLPYLSEVMVQDGVLWMRNHPENPSVRLLDRLLHGKTGEVNYTTWCQQKFVEIQNKVHRHEAKKKAEEDLLNFLVNDQSQRKDEHLELMGKMKELVSTKFSSWDAKNLFSTLTYLSTTKTSMIILCRVTFESNKFLTELNIKKLFNESIKLRRSAISGELK